MPWWPNAMAAFAALNAADVCDVVVLGCASHSGEVRDALAGQAEVSTVDNATMDWREPAQHPEAARAAAQVPNPRVPMNASSRRRPG